MSYHLATSKLQSEHLGRCAYVYVRQSTIQQVRENTTSAARQYDLTKLAADFGWPQSKIIVVDQDQARSGSSTDGRDGFKKILSEVALGNVGAVISLEASRLARDSSDWHLLLKLCNYSNTLIIDEHNIFDPRNENDRLCLGIKGTFSELELGLIKGRLAGGRIKKAHAGKLYGALPVGLVFAEGKKVVLDPDQEVQNSLRFVLGFMDSFSSLRAAIRYFNEHKLLFPLRPLSGPKKGILEWVPLTYSRAHYILTNPAYAGAYVYGRSKTEGYIPPDGTNSIRRRSVSVSRDKWEIVIQGAHEGYITWGQYLHNRQRLESNCFLPVARGAARSGSALLQGMVLCGKCGRKMRVTYPNGVDGRSYYYCPTYGDSVPSCQFIAAPQMDDAVTCLLFQAFQPAQLQISMETLRRLCSQTSELERQWQLRLERSQYEADLAYRQFNHVDPSNRHVAGTLERIWNERLVEIDQLKSEWAALRNSLLSPLTAAEQQSVMALAEDVPKIWYAPTTTSVERKQLLRLMIKDITLFKESHKSRYSVRAGVRWQTEACTELYFSPLGVTGRPKTDPDAVTLIRELAESCTDREIAERLNARGLKSRNNLNFNWAMVRHLRYRFNIETFGTKIDQAKAQGYTHTLIEVAKLLDRSDGSIWKWVKKGTLDAIQILPKGLWLIKITPEVMRLRKSN
jgi:DNA invertase Pin-like site-specific DNA recombinase